jgi:hypothetical protein
MRVVLDMATPRSIAVVTAALAIGAACAAQVADTQLPTLTQVALAPSSTSLSPGANQQFTVTATWSDGSTTAPAVTYSATGGTITAAGLYTAGSTAGSFRVIAVQQGGTLADTSAVTITAPTATLTSLSLTPASTSLATGGSQQFAVSGTWSDGSTTTPAVTYSATGGSITAVGLYTAGSTAGSFRVIAVQQGGTLADTSAVTITAGVGTVLVSEGFEDGNLGGRGWFDATTVAVATDARPGSSGTHALQWHWAVGGTAPQAASRHDFTPSNSVYLSYWIKMSANWVGSGLSYHPHLLHFLTTADDHYSGLSATHLTAYDELLYLNGNLVANLMLQDALMIDETKLNQDLRATTEHRSIGGYNGRYESSNAQSTVGWDTYAFAYGMTNDLGQTGQHTNYKQFRPTATTIANADKNSWHHIESYWQMNTVVGGIGQQDGVVQYWVDGRLLIDRHDVYLRTGVYPTMQFRTFVMAPYIQSPGSPADQSMWIDDLVIATAHP